MYNHFIFTNLRSNGNFSKLRPSHFITEELLEKLNLVKNSKQIEK
jgi:hypothetical protein